MAIPRRHRWKKAFPYTATSPYARSENHRRRNARRFILRRHSSWRIAKLRYQPGGRIQAPCLARTLRGLPNNLVPMVAQVASGQARRAFSVWKRLPTPTVQVCETPSCPRFGAGHVLASITWAFIRICSPEFRHRQGIFSLDVIEAFEKASGRRVNYRIAERVRGDVAECWALQRRLSASWVGKRVKLLTRCAGMRGAGKLPSYKTPRKVNA